MWLFSNVDIVIIVKQSKPLYASNYLKEDLIRKSDYYKYFLYRN